MDMVTVAGMVIVTTTVEATATSTPTVMGTVFTVTVM